MRWNVLSTLVISQNPFLLSNGFMHDITAHPASFPDRLTSRFHIVVVVGGGGGGGGGLTSRFHIVVVVGGGGGGGAHFQAGFHIVVVVGGGGGGLTSRQGFI